LVFQGQLHGNHVTIKKHSVISSSEQNLPPSMSHFELCRNEAQILPKLQHKNIVKLLGFCAERSETIVVYEHMENGSLEDVIFGMLICLLIQTFCILVCTIYFSMF
jgi:interleukin-1 receptor-associated kinase 1